MKTYTYHVMYVIIFWMKLDSRFKIQQRVVIVFEMKIEKSSIDVSLLNNINLFIELS